MGGLDPNLESTTDWPDPAKALAAFEAWPKIPRWNKDVIVTEKIDGTNAALVFGPDGDWLKCQSRNRFVTPDDDNYGFARWAAAHAELLFEIFGPGRHYGEWWGQGIQRGYGIDGRRFTPFRMRGAHGEPSTQVHPDVEVWTLPLLAQGRFHAGVVTEALDMLDHLGSFAAPGYSRPEGVVLYHTASRQSYKALLENDDIPKSAVV